MKFRFLESVRGIAAVVVFVNHLIEIVPQIAGNRNLFISAVGAWGTEAVIVFFFLSGLVINISYKQNTSVSKIQFLKKRILRIYPIYFVVVLISLFVEFLVGQFYTSGLTVLGNLLFLATLQGYIIKVLWINPVIWSLTFEVFFYFLFSLSLGSKHQIFMKLWCGIAVLCSVFYYWSFPPLLSHFITLTAYSAIWLLGYYTYELHNYVRVNLTTSLLSLSMFPLVSRLQLTNKYYDIATHFILGLLLVPIFVFYLNEAVKRKDNSNPRLDIKLNLFFFIYLLISLYSFLFSKSLLISKVIYICLPLLYLALSKISINNLIVKSYSKMSPYLVFLGKISYALYLVHRPIMELFSYYFANNLVLNLFFLSLSTLTICVFLELFFQPLVKSSILRLQH